MLTHEDGLKLRKLIQVGEQLSLIAWNRGVNNVDLSPSLCRMLTHDWEQRRREAASVIQALGDLPRGFDPIVLGC